MMKLLFDQNISFRVVKKINPLFPDSKQVNDLNLSNSSDKSIWEKAKQDNYCVVTFDADFSEFANIYGCPPKIIWLRTGNITTNVIVKLIENHYSIIEEFLCSDAYKNVACMEIENYN